MKYLARARIRKRWATWLLLLVGMVLVAAELGSRWLGLVDFPVYDANSRIGYIPTANQHGSFMRRNDWQINEHHMGARPFKPSPDGNVLLIGDSIVWGGNSYAGPERLAAQLQSRLRASVWPIAAGSWGLQNELAYLNDNPDVVAQVDQIVFVSNSGDFDQPSSWTCATTHPRERPALALVFLVKKHVLKTECPSVPAPELKVAARDPLEMLRQFARAHPGKPLKFVLYPDKPECVDDKLRQGQLEKYKVGLLAAGATAVYALGDWAGWRPCASIYKDDIHPFASGLGLLATFIADNVLKGS